MSGRDIRRLVAQASVFPNAEKTNMALRLVAAAGAPGVERVLMSTDAMGVAGGVRGPWQAPGEPGAARRWSSSSSTRSAAPPTTPGRWSGGCVPRGAAVIVLLGGDGTVRAAAAASGDVALLPLSTGTNNAFPEMWEATVAGTAAGLLATGRSPPPRPPTGQGAARRRRRSPTRSRWSTSASRPSTHVGVEGAVAAGARCASCTARSPSRTLSACPASPGCCTPCARTDPHGVAVRSAPPAPAPCSPRSRRRRRPDRRPRGRAAGRRRRRSGWRCDAARSRSTASARSSSVRPPRSPSPSRTTGPACSTCAPSSPPPPSAGSWSPTRPAHPAGGSMKAARFHGPGDIRIDDVPEPRSARAGQGRRRLVRYLRHRSARVPGRPDLHPAEGVAAPAHRRGDAGGDGPRVRRRGLRGRRPA